MTEHTAHPASTIAHGTIDGVNAHRRAGERLCPHCVVAWNARMNANYIRSGRRDSIRVPVELVAVLVADASPRVATLARTILHGNVIDACTARTARSREFAQHLPDVASTNGGGR